MMLTVPEILVLGLFLVGFMGKKQKKHLVYAKPCVGLNHTDVPAATLCYTPIIHKDL